MKTLNNVFRILTLVFGVGALVLFFFPFATVTASEGVLNFTGTELAFGGASITETNLFLAKSSQVLFCFLCTAVSAAFAFLSLKFKGSRYVVPFFSVVAGIYLLVIRCSNPGNYIDFRPLTNVSGLDYSMFVLLAIIALLVLTVVSVVYLFTADYVEVMASGKRLPLAKRIVKFLRDYKGEVSKIVWPRPKAVIKNTVIVFIMCAIIGAFIWLLEWGLGSLVNLILGGK